MRLLDVLSGALCVLGLFLLPSAAAAYLSTDLIVDPAAPIAGEPVVIRADGWVPDSCWSPEITHECERVGHEITLSLFTTDTWTPGIACLTVVEPFSAECELGALTVGEYTVTVTEVRESLRDPEPVVRHHTFAVQAAVTTEHARWSTIKAMFGARD